MDGMPNLISLKTTSSSCIIGSSQEWEVELSDVLQWSSNQQSTDQALIIYEPEGEEKLRRKMIRWGIGIGRWYRYSSCRK